MAVAISTQRRTSALAWAPPALVTPTIVDYTDAGPYDVTAGVQRAPEYQFPANVDLVVRLPLGWNHNGYGVNARQATPVRRPAGVLVWGGRNVVVPGGEIDVAADYATQQATSHGYPDYGLNTHNRALTLRAFSAGTTHVEGVKISGAWLYEAIDLLGNNARTIQFCNILVDDVVGPDGRKAGVRYHPEYAPGSEPVPGGDHDGGDVMQPHAGWGALRIDGLEARRSWFQGLFLPAPATYEAGTVDIRNVSLRDFEGPGAAYRIGYQLDGTTPVVARVHNVWFEPTPIWRNGSGVTGQFAFNAGRRTVRNAVYTRNVAIGGSVLSDEAGPYATSAELLDDLAQPGGRVRQGRPGLRVLSGNPGSGYTSPGYLTTNPSVLRIPGV